MKRLLFALLLCCCTLPATAQGFDLTRPDDVHFLQQLQRSEKALPQPWRPSPGPDDPRADGYCWGYGSDSNYHPENACTFSSSSCLDNCYKQEQTCADNCAANHGGDCGSNGSACETCQDGCRTRFNSCENSCA